MEEHSAAHIGVEIERKFKVALDQIPGRLSDYSSANIHQAYLVFDENGKSVRVRKKNSTLLLTVKGDAEVGRKEVEFEISAEVFQGLWELAEGTPIEKIRYEIPYNNHIVEVDVFSGSLSGLVIAEVEFPTFEDCKQFTPPEWFGEEVTSDSRYKNKNLTRYGLPEA